MLWFLVLIILVIILLGTRKKSPKSIGHQAGTYDPDRHRIADEIVAWSNLPEHQAERYTYLAIAESVRSGLTPAITQAGANIPSAFNPPPPPTVLAPTPSFSLNDAFKSLDNINIMLYLGAFLIVVSAGIFIGYNFGVLSGVTKTLVLAAFAAVFYGTGLMFYLKSPRLKPAGTTFTAIGLVLAPLVGLAAYNFIFKGGSGQAVWFVTSLAVFALYGVSVKIVRQTYIAYLMAFVSLSLFESTINLFNVPLYYLGWGMALMSLALLLIGKRRGAWAEIDKSFEICANIFLPLSIVLSYSLVQANGFRQLGIELLISSLFYLVASSMVQRADEQTTFFGLSLSLFPIGLTLAIGSILSHTALAYLIVAIGAVYVGMCEVINREGLKRELLMTIGGVLALLAGSLVTYSELNLAIVAALALGINAVSLIRHRQTTNLFLSIIAGLALPYLVVANIWHLPNFWLAISYFLVGLILVAVRISLKTWEQQAGQIAILGYVLAFVMAMGWAIASSSWTIAATGLALAAVAYWLSLVENQPSIVIASAGLIYTGTTALVYSGHFYNPDLYVYLFMGVGVGLYALGSLGNDARSRLYRFMGIIGPYVGAGVRGSFDLQNASPILSLFVAGGLTMVEATVQKLVIAQEIGAAVIVTAFEWLLGFAGVRQEQVFTHIWALYFAVLAYRYRHHYPFETKDWLTAIALSILTIPLMQQSLAPLGQYYGLLLTFESLGIILVGMALKYKLVLYWGIATLVAEVLYQLKDVLFALPKYVISAALGLALLGAAIYFLSSRHEN